MNAYKTYVEVDSSGRLMLDRLPFQKGVLLEVLIVDQSMLSDENVSSWQALMRHVQNQPQSSTITDEDIAAEINDVRNIR
ncbi:MAG: hypothetical protein ACOYOE_05935 [Chlorobium sp.]